MANILNLMNFEVFETFIAQVIIFELLVNLTIQSALIIGTTAKIVAACVCKFCKFHSLKLLISRA